MASNYQRLFQTANNRTLTKSDSQEQASSGDSADSSGSSGSSGSSSGYLDCSQNEQQENVVPSLSNRLALEMHIKRKAERLKLINTNRNLLSDQYNNLFLREPSPEEAEEESRDERDHEPNNLTPIAEQTESKLRVVVDNTYVVGGGGGSNNNSGNKQQAEQQRGSGGTKLYSSTKSAISRNKALEQWRKNRQLARAKKDNRPVFKVYHVNPKDFDFVVQNKAPVLQPPPKLNIHQMSQIRPSDSMAHIPMIAKGVAGFKTSSPKTSAPATSRLANKTNQPPFYFGTKNPQAKFEFAASLGNNATTKKPVQSKPADGPAKPAKAANSSSAKATAPKIVVTRPKADSTKNSRSDSSASTNRSSNSSQASRSSTSSSSSRQAGQEAQVEDLTSRLSSAVTLEQLAEETHEEVRRRSSSTTQVIAAEPEDPRATDLTFDFESVALESRDVKYYRSLVINRTKLLNDYSSRWLSLCDNSGAPEDVQGEIRSACGLAQLLIDERFDQFSALIGQCEASAQKQQVEGEEDGGVKLVLCSDLQGFWDMVEYQVRDVEKKFAYLKLLKDHDYLAENIPVHFLNPPAAKTAKKKFIKPFVSQRPPVQKQESEEAMDTEPKSPASKPASKSLGFRSQLAQLKAARLLEMKQKAASTQDISVDFVMTKRKSVSSDDVCEHNNRRKSAARKSVIRPQTPRALADVPETDEGSKRYNLRARPSQVTKFDSPMLKSSRKSVKRVSLFPKPEIIEYESEAAAAAAAGVGEQSTIVHSDETTRQWSGADMASPIAFKETAAGAGLNRESMSSTPLMSFRARARQSLGLTLNPIDVAKSPLLKLAMISSHGKRASLSVHQNNTSRQF